MDLDEKVKSAIIELNGLMPELRDSSALTPNVYTKLENIFRILGNDTDIEVLQIYARHGFTGYNAIVNQADGLLKRYSSSE